MKKKMKLLLILSLLVFSVAEIPFKSYHEPIGVPQATRIKFEEVNLSKHSRIIDGYYSFLGQHPFFGGLVIQLTSGLVSVCGSTLLSNNVLLTAAHCWYDGVSQARQLEVVLGSLTLFSGGTRVTSDYVITHSNYNTSTWKDDIAAIITSRIEYSYYIKPVSLPLNNESNIDTAIAVGFGKTCGWSGITIDQTLKHLYLTVISNEECAQSYSDFITEGNICTRGRYNQNPCGGDSGGPLYYNNANYTKKILIGIMSFGSVYGCQVGRPYVHTRIDSYSTWLRKAL